MFKVILITLATGEAYLESWMIQVILVAGLLAGLWKGYKLAVMDKEDNKHGDT